jgi:hypothetical protein
MCLNVRSQVAVQRALQPDGRLPVNTNLRLDVQLISPFTQQMSGVQRVQRWCAHADLMSAVANMKKTRSRLTWARTAPCITRSAGVWTDTLRPYEDPC